MVFEFLLKMRFIFTYNAPWNAKQIWGSETHAVLYPLTVAHATVATFQALVASILSAPVYPFLGSAVFLVSYFRPLKFWERSYQTKRIDDDSLRLDSQPKPAGVTANNLNSLFYEEVTQELQRTLASDIRSGRLGDVSAGDVLLLLDSDNRMTFFLHIVELGGGYVSFQVRGLEFAGTYCQARELEALDADQRDERWLCWFGERNSARLWPRALLGLNTIAQLRWVTWQPIYQQMDALV